MKRFVSGLERVLEFAMAVGLLVIAATVVLQVVLNAGFDSSLTGANELITKLFVYVTAIGAAVATSRDEHISITVATERFSVDVQCRIHQLKLLLLACLNAVVVIYSVHWIDVTGHYLMPTTQLPRFVAQLSIPFGAVLAVMFCVARLFFPATLNDPGTSDTEALQL